MDKINEFFRSCDVDCVLLKTSERIRDENFHYFTKLDKYENPNGILILRKNKQPVVLASQLEYGNLAGNRNFHTLKITTKKDLNLIMKKLPRRIGINYSATTLESLKNLRSISKKKFVDVSKFLSLVRAEKTKDEIKKIKTACRMTEEILDSVIGKIKQGMTEKFVDQKIEELIEKMEVHSAFPTIVASGSNSAVPHHISGIKKINKGVLLIDMGVVFENYCSDITRTFFVGHAPEQVKNSYSVVKKAQISALALVKEGVKASTAFETANCILKKELSQSLIHGLGHGLGLDVHDFPEGFTEKSRTVLKKDMVFTMEPGYYKGYGIRIEDDLVVGKSSPIMLTKSPKEIVEI
ncbi:MAG: Xaa-Pro peptidase family protein [Candidatus Aenigmarchaeota archaeon]|nr:Xaa-Pro peptidase family protein [Candidatus Aenigmarchaeota archaeon]